MEAAPCPGCSKKLGFPTIGHHNLSELKPTHIRELLETVQACGAIETAHRLRQRISAVFRFAIASGLSEIDPSAAIGSALRPVIHGKQPALLKLDDARKLFVAFEAEPGHPTTKLASRLLALTAARPGTVQLAQLDEFENLDGTEPLWRIPAEKSKATRRGAISLSRTTAIPLPATRPRSTQPWRPEIRRKQSPTPYSPRRKPGSRSCAIPQAKPRDKLPLPGVFCRARCSIVPCASSSTSPERRSPPIGPCADKQAHHDAPTHPDLSSKSLS